MKGRRVLSLYTAPCEVFGDMSSHDVLLNLLQGDSELVREASETWLVEFIFSCVEIRTLAKKTNSQVDPGRNSVSWGLVRL